LTTLGCQIKVTAADQPIPVWYWSAVTAFFVISLGANALLTALIVYKIIIVYHDVRGFNTAGDVQASAYGDIHGHRDLYPLISILIESGLITFAAQLVQAIMYKSAPAAFPLVGGCVVMLYVRVSSRLSIWCFNFIYLHREFRRQLSLCVSRWASPTTIIHQGQRIQRILGAPCSLHHFHRSSTRPPLRSQMIRMRRFQREDGDTCQLIPLHSDSLFVQTHLYTN
jgi:hypothetical protein